MAKKTEPIYGDYGKLIEMLTGCKKVDETCFETFAPYYAQRAKQYRYPVFYQSIAEMTACNYFYWKIIDGDVLCIFKRLQWLKTFAVMLHMAPISLHGDRRKELAVIMKLFQLGIPMKATAEDINRYQLPRNVLTPIDGNNEYIYSASEAVSMAGSKFRRFRNQVKHVFKADGFEHLQGASDDIEAVVRAWDARAKERSIEGSQSGLWRTIARMQDKERLHIHRIYVAGKLACFSVIEELSPNHWVVVMRVRNYDCNLNDVSMAMHHLDALQCAGAMNLGCAGKQQGLAEEKEHLKPCAHQQIYRLNPWVKFHVTEELRDIFRTK